jgi:HNH endonuclease
MLSLKNVRDDDLLRQLSSLVKQSRGVESEVVAHIGEVETRRLYARKAWSSMFEYCRRVLHLRENEAYLRITVARASRQNPALLEMLADGRLHLSGIARLAPHLTRDNAAAVLQRACGMSHREIRELVAELEPKADVATLVRKLPQRQLPTSGDAAQLGAPRGESDAVSPALGLAAPPRPPVAEPASPRPALAEAASLRPAFVEGVPTSPPLVEAARPRPAFVEPLAPGRYQVRFTASVELRDKLERLQALMRSSVPDGDLARIIDIAVSEKLERIEARRFGRTKAPRLGRPETDARPPSRHIPAAVRRWVHARDGGRCAYTAGDGLRCAKRHDLEFHHKHPFAHGGDHGPANLTLLCRTHNTLLAEHDYGEDVMARFRAAASSRRVPVDAYGARITGQPRRLLSG